MARVRVPVAFTRIDRWIVGGLLTVLAAAVGVVWLSQSLVAPPRPRVSASERAIVGLALRSLPAGGLRVVRAIGPANDAGLRAGDRIVAIDELRNPALPAFVDRVRSKGAGETVRIEARRGPAGDGEVPVLADVAVIVRPVSPADEGLPYEDLTFRNAAGLTLRGWYIPPPADGSGRAPGIAWGHGNAADRRQWLPFALAVHDAGIAQVLLDFTGRGESDGEVITLGAHESADLRAALDLLTARPEVDPMRLALGGKSMGAVAAILEAADDPRVKALVLDSAYADLTATVDRVISGYHVPAVLVRPMLLAVAGWRANYDPSHVRPAESIRRVKAPMLILQGDHDRLVPPSDAAALKAAAGGPVTLVSMKGIDHNSQRPEEIADRVAAFLRSTLSPGR